MGQTILETRALSKKYGSIQALDQLSLSVEKGSVFGILGPNGSGKTTTLSIVLGAVHATSGDYSWFGGDKPEVARKRIGALLEKPNFLPYLSGLDNLKMVAAIKNVSSEKIEECLRITGMYERRKSSFKTYSLGMKQRLALAAVLLSDPEVLVLDEPTNGLDPQGIVEIRELIISLAKAGKTIILASHLLDEVEKVCTDVAILKTGTLRQHYDIGGVQHASVVFEVATDDLDELESFFKGKPEVMEIRRKADMLLISMAATTQAGDMNKELSQAGLYPTHFKKTKESLESAFLSATGGKA